MAASELLVLGMWDLVPKPEIEAGPPYTGSAKPSPLDHQGSPQAHISNKLPEDAVATGQWITC